MTAEDCNAYFVIDTTFQIPSTGMVAGPSRDERDEDDATQHGQFCKGVDNSIRGVDSTDLLAWST